MSKVERLRQDRDKAQERVDRLSREETERREAIEERRDLAAQATERVRARTLIPGGTDTAAVEQAEVQVEELEREIEELEAEQEEAEEAAAEAEERYQAALREAIPREAEHVIEARRGVRSGYADLAESALPAFAELRKALAATAEAEGRLKDLTQDLDQDYSGRPRRELKAHLRRELQNLTGAEAIGFILARALQVARLADGEIAAALAEHGIEPRHGSILNNPTFLTEGEIYAVAEQDRLPRTISL